MPSSPSWVRCAGLRRSASRPPCTDGCSVLTRPSNASGKPVTSLTGVHETPASASTRAVEPVDTTETPASRRAAPSSPSPLLSLTLTSARRIGCLVMDVPSLTLYRLTLYRLTLNRLKLHRLTLYRGASTRAGGSCPR